MGDDSERTDRASDPDAGTSDDGSSGNDDFGSDPAAEAPTSASDSESDLADRSDDGPTEVDAAATVERLRAGDSDGDDAEDAEGSADATADDRSTAEPHEVESSSEDVDTNDGDIDEPPGPPDVPEIDRDGTDGEVDVDGAADGEVDVDGAADDDADDTDDIWPGDRGAPADAAEATGTDGGTPATAGGTATGTAGSEDSLVDDGLVSEGPETDEEMPLADHIEEMIRRLAVVLGVGGIITLLLYPGADLVNSAFGLDLVSSTEVIDFLWNKHVPGAPEITDRRPRVYGPLELLLTELKVAALGGLVVGLPVFVYETYLFMRPGLYLKERRYYLAAVPTSIVLAFVGISFAHFIVLPAIFAYFTSYTTGTAVVAFGLKETFNLILILMGYNAIIFQIPLFIMLAIMMNLVTRTWLEARRLLFWGAFLGLAFLISPDPTGMAPIIIGATMIALFEGTLLALRWTRSGDGAAT
jgi:sec-independent protein translocase protein TatC